MKIQLAIGKQLHDILDDAEVSAERLADEARQLGLPWSRATIQGVIAGDRRFNLGEVLVLTDLLARLTGKARPLPIEALIPPDETIDIGGLLVPGEALIKLANGKRLDPKQVHPVVTRERAQRRVSARKIPGLHIEMLQALAMDADASFEDVVRDGVGEAEMKTAVRMGTIPELIAIAARAKWGTSLTAERDRLGKMRGKHEPREFGHITRELAAKLDKDQLRPLRVALLRKLVPGVEPAAVIVAEASERPATLLASRLRTISEYVVIASGVFWDRSPAEELKRRRAKIDDANGAEINDKQLLDAIAHDLRPKMAEGDPRLPMNLTEHRPSKVQR